MTMGSSVSYQTYSKYKDGYWYSAEFDKDWFGEGASRYAFRGTLHSDGPKDGEEIVVKVFKQAFARNLDQWTPDLIASKKAQAFAAQFNEVAKENGIICAGNISFRIPLILKVSDVAHFNLLWLFRIFEGSSFVFQGEYVAVEDFIPGKYIKFNSNSGYEDQNLSQFLTAFCHWTWQVSGHKIMVCDLQGVKSNNGYLLTDPAVHSEDQIYGPTDLGIVGMENVLRGHKCNRICNRLQLKNPLEDFYRTMNPMSTFYDFQLTEEEQLRNRRKQPMYLQFKPADVVGEE